MEITCWTVTTGWDEAKKKHARTIIDEKCKGFVGIIVEKPHKVCVWLFDSENNAKIARNILQSEGIYCDSEIHSGAVHEEYLALKDDILRKAKLK